MKRVCLANGCVFQTKTGTSRQDIGLKRQCLKLSRIRIKNQTVKENVLVSLHRRQNQNSFPSVAVQSLWRLPPWLWALSQGKRPSDCCRLVLTKRTSLLYRQVWTERNSRITRTTIQREIFAGPNFHKNPISPPEEIFAFSASYWPRPFIVAGLTEDERCPVGKGRALSASLK